MASSSNEADVLENDSFDLEETKEHASDEDTEDASETEVEKKEEEFTGIKEQMYQDKLAQFRRQLDQLKEGTLPYYMKKVKKLNEQLTERIQFNSVWSEKQLCIIEEQYKKEKEAAAKEFEEKKIELRESLIQELEMKKKQIENERNVMELTGDTMTVKPVTTRKLRRRPNDPLPVPEKRGKPSPVQLSHGLEDRDIFDDIDVINKLSGSKSTSKSVTSSHATSLSGNTSHVSHDVTHDASVEEGRLLYDKKWFAKDQTVVVENKDIGKVNYTVVNISHDEILLKKISDSSKLRISLHQLQTGQYSLKKRTL